MPPQTIKTMSNMVQSDQVQVTKIPETMNKINRVTAADLIQEFKMVFDGKIRTMPCEEFHIVLMDDMNPFCVSTPKTVPLPLMQPLKDELDLLVDIKIVKMVTEPTDWFPPISIAMKEDGKCLRMYGDFTKPNKYVKREIHDQQIQIFCG